MDSAVLGDRLPEVTQEPCLGPDTLSFERAQQCLQDEFFARRCHSTHNLLLRGFPGVSAVCDEVPCQLRAVGATFMHIAPSSFPLQSEVVGEVCVFGGGQDSGRSFLVKCGAKFWRRSRACFAGTFKARTKLQQPKIPTALHSKIGKIQGEGAAILLHSCGSPDPVRHCLKTS